jgi:hypothetical protein
MKIKIPTHTNWDGKGAKPIDGAMKRLFEQLEKEEEQGETQGDDTAEPVEGFIYVPTIDLYFAKQRTLQGENWENTHKQLYQKTLELPHKPRLRMPKPTETWDLIFYLKEHLDNPDFKKVCDDILKKTPEGKWHGEWQNILFSEERQEKYFQYVVDIDSNGKLVFSEKQKLENCLNQDGFADILDKRRLSSQGLCNTLSKKQTYIQGENIYFWYPRNGAVAGFLAGSDGVVLSCGRYPSSRSASLGVRACAEGTQKNQRGGT